VIRVYDQAGNVIETPSTKAISKSGDLLLNFLPDDLVHEDRQTRCKQQQQ
jgi:hypothetical protein